MSNSVAAEHCPILAKGPAIGRYLDRDIPAWVQLADGTYNFEGVATGPHPGVVDVRLLPDDAVLIKPGLCYLPAAKPTK